MQRINQLRKPHNLENLGTMVDSQRVLQTLVNTQNIEDHEQESASKNLNSV